MAIKKILLYPNPLLLQPSARIEKFDKSLVSLSKDLIDTMYDADGVGLAAPQIGINKRIFVMDCSREDEEKDCTIVQVRASVCPCVKTHNKKKEDKDVLLLIQHQHNLAILSEMHS